jgi:hypothetical protein
MQVIPVCETLCFSPTNPPEDSPVNHALRVAVLTLSTCLAASAIASERPAHFKGVPSHTLTEAVANLSDYNQRLEAALSQELTPERMAEVHILSYTLENALNKINEELDQIAETLEEVHVASETAQPQTVKTQGERYLSAARSLVR